MTNPQECIACHTTIDVRKLGRVGHEVFLCQRDINAIAVGSTLTGRQPPSLKKKEDRDFVAEVFNGATVAEREDFLKENLGLCREFFDIGKRLLPGGE